MTSWWIGSLRHPAAVESWSWSWSWSRATMIALLLLAPASCTPRDAGVTAVGPVGADDHDLRLQRAIAELEAETERARELQFIEPIDAVTMTPEELRALVQSQVNEVDMTVAQRIMVAFGFIPPGVDLGEQMVDILAQEVLGMYDPEDDRLVVLSSVADDLDDPTETAMEARMVLVHELTHALQDQHFDTLDHTGEEVWSDDQGSVYSCLAEGDATLTMMVSSLSRSDLPVDPTMHPRFREILRSQGELAVPESPAMSAAPPYFGHVFAAIYLEGASFAADLRRLGGWPAVNDAHRSPPRATRDILHTEAYLQGAPITELELPEPLPGLEDGGYERVASAVLGELETGAFLLPIDDTDRLRRAAEGWAGDRFAVYELTGGGGLALVWRLRFVDAGEATEFVDAAHDTALASGRGRCADAPLNEGQDEPRSERRLLCHDSRDLLEQRGPEVVILRDVPAESVELIAEAVFEAPAVERAGEPHRPGAGGA